MPKIPSEKLRSLASSNKATNSSKFLKTTFTPQASLIVSPAAQQKSLLNILNTTGNRNEAANLVGYDTRSKCISFGLKTLVKSVKLDWEDGWEEQVGCFWNVLMTCS